MLKLILKTESLPVNEVQCTCITVTNCLFIFYHLITFILASLITYDKLEKSIQVGI